MSTTQTATATHVKLVDTGEIIDLDTYTGPYYYAYDTDAYYADDAELIYCVDLEEYVTDSCEVFITQDTQRFFYYQNNLVADIDGNYYESSGNLVYCADVNEYVDPDTSDVVYVEDVCEYWYHAENAHYSERQACYLSEPDNILLPYHSDTGKAWRADTGEVRFGVEIETYLDLDAFAGIDWEAVNGSNWIVCEEDGSLPPDAGEIISDVIDSDNKNLFLEKLKDFLDTYQIDLEKAKRKEGFGGHIHVSHKDMSLDEVEARLTNFLPFFAGLYPERTETRWCAANKSELVKESGKDKIKSEDIGDRYQVLNRSSKTVEIRIFPTPVSVDQLSWRLELIELVLQYNSLTDILIDIENKGRLFNHFTKIFGDDTAERLDASLRRGLAILSINLETK